MSLVKNELGIYFGDDYIVNDLLKIHSPTINDVITMGEENYFNVVYTLAAIPSDMKYILWTQGICWEDISDFEFFCMLVGGLKPEYTKVFFGDIDFTKFRIGINPESGEKCLGQFIDGKPLIIDRLTYQIIADVIRIMHNITPKVEKASTKTVRRILIELDKERIEKQKKEDSESYLLPLISSLANCGAGHGIKEIREMTIYAFMDSIMRVQIVKSADALLKGCYSGMIDTSKVNKKELNWMRNLRDGK